jgi:hypothetical protein
LKCSAGERQAIEVQTHMLCELLSDTAIHRKTPASEIGRAYGGGSPITREESQAPPDHATCAQWLSRDYLGFCSPSSWVFTTDMDCKFFISPPLVELLHFVERIASGWPRRIERPCAFRAAEALKARLFNPYKHAERVHPGTPRDL